MSTAPSAWSLFDAGKYREALSLFEQKCVDEPTNAPHFYNLGKVRLLVDDYEGALAAFARALAVLEPRYHSGTEFIMLGVCHWYLDRPSGMIEALRRANTAPYTDAAGGVTAPAIMLYVAERLRDSALGKEAHALLKEHARRRRRGWPAPVVPFLLQQLGGEELYRIAESIPELSFRHRCQAHFYLGLNALRAGDRGTFMDRMRAAASDPHAYLECEYFLARWEVLRDFPDPAFASPA